MISQVSLLNWRNIVEPHLTKSQKSVISVMKALDRPCTNEEVALQLGKYPNQTSGRFTELKTKGEIIEAGTKRVNGKVHTMYELAPEEAD
jgi:hypothetical protein